MPQCLSSCFCTYKMGALLCCQRDNKNEKYGKKLAARIIERMCNVFGNDSCLCMTSVFFIGTLLCSHAYGFQRFVRM